MKTTAIELNPQVIMASRVWFKLAENNTRMQVLQADAAKEICDPRWCGTVDSLQVDLYDDDAAAPVLDSVAFYTDCRRMLSDEGCITVNLFGRSSSYAGSVDQMAGAFGRDAIWAFKPTREGNTVVLAQRTPSRPKTALLNERAAIIEAQWGLPATKWVRALRKEAP